MIRPEAAATGETRAASPQPIHAPRRSSGRPVTLGGWGQHVRVAVWWSHRSSSDDRWEFAWVGSCGASSCPCWSWWRGSWRCRSAAAAGA